ncbi:hypothetical protein EUGRSUZ_H02910 [Eucalyptus grandis]|uniref:Uncharacterized protein n=2 Tax=Eucalyptus grandis TaxID=71139 RepID=A0ACC3JTB0_EUCGR|nr:hypothetical protein EUGRSUZ_H02910 [Eucalyptus grandis]
MDMALEALEALPTELSKPVSADIDIEKVREAAAAHFEDLTADQKEAARSLFDTMNKDKNDKISIHEFRTFLSDAGLRTVNPDDLFAELDKDDNKNLSFEELVTFFYVLSRDEYKHLLKRRPSTDVRGQQARTGRGTEGEANDEGRKWTKILPQLYDKFKGTYNLEEWVSENSCTII